MKDASQNRMAPFSSVVELLTQVESWGDDLIFIVDRNFFVQYLNNALETPLTSSMGKATASRWDCLFSREILEPLRSKFGAVFDTGTRVTHEGKVLVGDREVWLDTRLTPIKDENGRVMSVLGVSREITEHKRKEELVSRSRQEWVRAVDTLPYVMASVDRHHRIEKVNAAMARELGVTVQEAVGLTCYKHIRGLTTPPPFCPLLQSAQHGDAQGADFIEEHKLGIRHITVRPIRDSAGKVVGCLYVARDTSDNHEAASRVFKNSQIMKQFLRQADHAVLIQDRDARYIFLNAVPGNGPGARGIVGKTPFDFFEPDEASGMVERVKSVAATGLDLSDERELNLDGEVFTFFERISPIWDSQGNIKQVVTISQKVSKSRLGVERCSSPEGERSTQPLSGRECEVLRLIAVGLTTKQIADNLFISKKTVETHRARIMQKLALHKASALVKYAIESGMV